MKIEKISNSQIRCILTGEDLASRQLRLSELAYGSDKARRLFREMVQLAGALKVRRMLGNGRDQEMTEQIIGLMSRTRSNADLFERMKGWEARAEKEGYTLGM